MDAAALPQSREKVDASPLNVHGRKSWSQVVRGEQASSHEIWLPAGVHMLSNKLEIAAPHVASVSRSIDDVCARALVTLKHADTCLAIRCGKERRAHRFAVKEAKIFLGGLIAEHASRTGVVESGEIAFASEAVLDAIRAFLDCKQ